MAQNDTIRTPSLKVGKDEVAGSNPAISSIEKPVTATVFGLFAFWTAFRYSQKPIQKPIRGIKTAGQVLSCPAVFMPVS